MWIRTALIPTLLAGLARAAIAADLPGLWDAPDPGASIHLDLSHAPLPGPLLASAGDAADPPAGGLAAEGAAAATKPPFGSKDSLRWYLQIAGAASINSDAEDTGFALLGGGVSFFIVDGLSLNVELNGLYFHLPGPDGGGVNFTLLTRWHMFCYDTWSFYVDGGAGLTGSSQRVPAPSSREPRGGTKFNFTPQAGCGFTWQFMPNTRLMTGVRWYHMSNAQTHDNNPGLDSIEVYAAVTFPF